MRKLKVLHRTLSVPSEPAEWELYAVLTESQTAAEEFNTAVDVLVEQWVRASNDGTFAPTVLGIEDANVRLFQPLFIRWSRVGADDSEARLQVRNVLHSIALALGAG